MLKCYISCSFKQKDKNLRSPHVFYLKYCSLLEYIYNININVVNHVSTMPYITASLLKYDNEI